MHFLDSLFNMKTFQPFSSSLIFQMPVLKKQNCSQNFLDEGQYSRNGILRYDLVTLNNKGEKHNLVTLFQVWKDFRPHFRLHRRLLHHRRILRQPPPQTRDESPRYRMWNRWVCEWTFINTVEPRILHFVYHDRLLLEPS